MRNAADIHPGWLVARHRGPIGDAALVTFPTRTALMNRARLASDALFRRFPAGAPGGPDGPVLFARLREAERYRESLPLGSAERDGADEIVRRLREAHRMTLH